MRVTRLSLAALAASLSLTLAATAQVSRNATLLGRLDPSSSYSDCWGYVAPDGREYALLCATPGVYVIDCSDPANPVNRGFFSTPSSSARDIRTYRNYMYATSEGSGGVQIIDLADPDNPRLVGTRLQSAWRNCHNVSIDTATGTLYACGTDRGMVIADLSADPENPTRLTSYSSNYVHDAQVLDGIAYVSEIFSGRLRLLDVTSLPSFTSMSTQSISVSHNAWPTRDNEYVVTTSETSGGFLNIVDVSDKRLPRNIASWRTRASATIHNAFVLDRVAHMSYYGDGYQAVDISDAPNPNRVAFYDTASAWGCYPFQPSGTIYISDIRNGLYVIDSKAAMRRYGDGVGSGGRPAPTIHGYGAAYAGNNNFALELDGAAPGTQAVLLVGVASASVTFRGLPILVDPTQPTLIALATADGAGNARVALPIPATTPDATLYAQWFAVDAGGPFGFTATEGIEFETFQP
ncbi:MAG: choice-of-anchor B family protein [Planctomycetota bacterium]